MGPGLKLTSDKNVARLRQFGCHLACWAVVLSSGASLLAAPCLARLEWVRVSGTGSYFVRDGSDDRFVVWGVNYDHDRHGRLIEDYWREEWDVVVEDVKEIKQLGANTVRVHLQLGKFMCAADRVNQATLARLAGLVRLAEQTGLYLNITGLGCYDRNAVPAWYDKLTEGERWRVQRKFWQAVAMVCRSSPAIFCYDLMNEPVLPGQRRETNWLAGEFAGKQFVQRISLDLRGRTQHEVAKQWLTELTSGIREFDKKHMITVGVIPWNYVFKGARPLFYSREVSGPLDFVSVHFYPKRGDVVGALEALDMYKIGKPLVIEEIYPLNCTVDEAEQFIDRSQTFADGWISFYWGETIDENRRQNNLGHQMMGDWLTRFSARAKRANNLTVEITGEGVIQSKQ
jgi:hypothetical protein